MVQIVKREQKPRICSRNMVRTTKRARKGQICAQKPFFNTEWEQKQGFCVWNLSSLAIFAQGNAEYVKINVLASSAGHSGRVSDTLSYDRISITNIV